MNLPNKPLSLMAAFATFKNMAECKKYKSQYQILSEFIKYIILKEHLYSFAVNEIQNFLHEYFGFEVPEAVIKTASKCLSYVHLQNHIFEVDHQMLSADSTNNDIENIKLSEEEKNATIIDALKQFANDKGITNVSSKVLTQQLVSYLLEDDTNISSQYSRLISEFILFHEDEENIQLQLNAIREGSILYLGLNHNINEIGSIQKPLILFLDTEVIFDLAGYNGLICQMLASNLLDQVKKANIGKETIRLCYFKEVRQEIEDYFKSAEYIVESQIPVTEKMAMKTILNGCASSADVRQKKADFDYRLNFSLGIHADATENYYSPDFEKYNLENADITDPKDQESWRFISHINKLRKGQTFPDILSSEYIFVTKTNNTLCKARELSHRLKAEMDLSFVSDCAISVEKMTSYLWLKLGGGFGQNEYPTSIRTILKARVVLAAYISRKIETVFNEAQQQFLAGEITEEQLAYRILGLKEKPILPEELEGESIEESLDFSAEYLRRFEEEVKNSKIKLAEREKEIGKLNADHAEEQQKTQDALAKIEELESKLEAMRKERQATEQRTAKRKKRNKTIIRSIGYLVGFLAATILVCLAYVKWNVILSIILAVGEVAGILWSVRNHIVHFWKKHFSNHKKSIPNQDTGKCQNEIVSNLKQ